MSLTQCERPTPCPVNVVKRSRGYQFHLPGGMAKISVMDVKVYKDIIRTVRVYFVERLSNRKIVERYWHRAEVAEALVKQKALSPGR